MADPGLPGGAIPGLADPTGPLRPSSRAFTEAKIAVTVLVNVCKEGMNSTSKEINQYLGKLN